MTKQETELVHRIFKDGFIFNSHGQILNAKGNVIAQSESDELVYCFIFTEKHCLGKGEKAIQKMKNLLSEWIADALTEKISREKFVIGPSNNNEFKLG